MLLQVSGVVRTDGSRNIKSGGKLQVGVQPFKTLIKPPEQFLNVLIIRCVSIHIRAQVTRLLADKGIVIVSIVVEELKTYPDILCEQGILEQTVIPRGGSHCEAS